MAHSSFSRAPAVGMRSHRLHAPLLLALVAHLAVDLVVGEAHLDQGDGQYSAVSISCAYYLSNAVHNNLVIAFHTVLKI
jgi:hypothetical protein